MAFVSARYLSCLLFIIHPFVFVCYLSFFFAQYQTKQTRMTTPPTGLTIPVTCEYYRVIKNAHALTKSIVHLKLMTHLLHSYNSNTPITRSVASPFFYRHATLYGFFYIVAVKVYHPCLGVTVRWP